MSAITLDQAQKILDKLIEAQLAGADGNLASVSIEGRSVSYRSAADLIALINFWSRVVTGLQRQAAGGCRTRSALADFR